MDTGAIIAAVIAVLGSVITLILAHYLKTAGRIVVTLTNAKWQQMGKSKSGRDKIVQLLDDTETMKVTMDVDIYNSSEDTKVVKVVYLEARTRFKQIKTVLLDDIDPIKLAPKQLEHINFTILFEPYEMDEFKKHKRVYFYLNLWSYEGKEIRSYFYSTQFYN